MNTYLYGIGPRTKTYMAEHPDMPINGILDGYRCDGEFCGIPVLALDKISTENTKIIIVARPASARIIYDRIKEFCIERNVEVYDVNGRRMELEKNDWQLKAEKIKIDTEKLYIEIDRHDVVSFDIFDTLLVRKCGSIEKLFSYVAVKNGLSYKFVEERIRAEKELSQNMVPNIEDIYQRLADNLSISKEESCQILLEEIEAEKKFLVTRREMAKALRYAVTKGKEVVLISDMYLSCKVLERILQEKGIDGYTNLFVSSEYGTDKAGNLFPIAVNKTAGENMLHIGDDEYRDYECAMRHGIDVFPVWSGTETTGWNLASPETIGYSLLGPALFSFALWLDFKLREDGINRIYFSARDGYLIKQIFDMVEQDFKAHDIKEPIASEYLLISRSLVTAASLWRKDDIRRVMEMSFDGEADEMLKRRFYLDKEEILPFEKNIDPETYILQHTKAILKKSKMLRDNYWKYLEGTGIKQSGRAAIFDFVAAGTCQMGLERIIGNPLYGYYYEIADNGASYKNVLHKKGFIQDIGGNRYSCDNYFYIETLIKETVPTLREIDDIGTAVYGKECMNASQKEIIKTVQMEVIKYAKDRLEFMPNRKFEPEEARENVFRLKWINLKLFQDDMVFTNYDAFSNREIRG